MKKTWTLLCGLAACVFLLQGGIATAADAGTQAEAQAMVKKAIAYYDKHGREKALAEFQQNPGPFVDRDLYVTVEDERGTVLSHVNPKMVGKDMMELRDPDGKYIVRERREASKRSTSGWQEYKFFNPVSRKVEPKRTYWERHDGIVFACGAYKKQ